MGRDSQIFRGSGMLLLLGLLSLRHGFGVFNVFILESDRDETRKTVLIFGNFYSLSVGMRII